MQSVGVERVLERAGVAKASLYNLFGSKEGLVLAYLQARHDGTTERLLAEVERHRDPRRRILALFDVQAQVFAQSGFRGCAFVSAMAEAPLGGQVAKATSNSVLGSATFSSTWPKRPEPPIPANSPGNSTSSMTEGSLQPGWIMTPR